MSEEEILNAGGKVKASNWPKPKGSVALPIYVLPGVSQRARRADLRTGSVKGGGMPSDKFRHTLGERVFLQYLIAFCSCSVIGLDFLSI